MWFETSVILVPVTLAMCLHGIIMSINVLFTWLMYSKK